METNKKDKMDTVTIRESITWGGSIDNETLQDVLADIQKAVPSVKITLLEARPSHTGGWPIFELTFSQDDLPSLAGLWELEVEDILERAAI
jgi:hypothetical protein